MDEVKSPMYATGVGLVIKGLQDLESQRKHGDRQPHTPDTQVVKAARKDPWWKSIFNTEILGDDQDDKI